MVVRKFGWLSSLLAAGIVFFGCESAARDGRSLDELDCYLVQMHIHGLSNHNGNDLPASMESHCFEAQRHGFDVIWWTDHAAIFESLDEDISVDFREASLDSGLAAVVLSKGRTRARELTRVLIARPDRGCDIRIEAGRLLVDLRAPAGSKDYTKVVLTLGSERGKVHEIEYCRPVASGLQFRTWGDVDGLEDDTYVRFGFDLSWHPIGQHHVHFDVLDTVDEGRRLIGDTTVVYEMGKSYSGEMVALDLAEAVLPLPSGTDNTLSSCYIEIGARKGKSISVALDSLCFHTAKPEGESRYETVESLSRRYRVEYGIVQYTGVEIGLFHTPRMPHMNAYFPESTQTFESVGLSRTMRRDEWVGEVHKRGGLVSLNHPFGASLNPRRQQGYDFPEGISLRDLSSRGPSVKDVDFWDVAEPILEDDGLGADILEVGYLFRGIGSLEDHLRLWDLALANGVNLVGNGASDSHGGRWGPDMVPNPFASWVWATGKGQDELLRALKAGTVAFGDPFLWRSKFIFGIEGVLMGDTLVVEPGEEVKGWIRMEPWRDDIELRLKQVRLKEGRDLDVVRYEAVEGRRGGIPITFDGACFVRVEVYEPDGTPLVFSNPVFLLPK